MHIQTDRTIACLWLRHNIPISLIAHLLVTWRTYWGSESSANLFRSDARAFPLECTTLCTSFDTTYYRCFHVTYCLVASRSRSACNLSDTNIEEASCWIMSYASTIRLSAALQPLPTLLIMNYQPWNHIPFPSANLASWCLRIHLATIPRDHLHEDDCRWLLLVFWACSIDWITLTSGGPNRSRWGRCWPAL